MITTQDVLARPVNADGHPIHNVGRPERPGDATFTDNVSLPLPNAARGTAGKSLVAAAADHVHPSAALLRIAANGVTVLAPGARVTLAKVKRIPGELFTPGGF